MKYGYNNIITSKWLKFFLLLVMVYFCKVNPLNNIYYSHNHVLPDYKISKYHFDVDIELATHHHHFDDRRHDNDHQHDYDANISWHFARTQSRKLLKLDDQYIYSSISFILSDYKCASCLNFKESPFINKYDSSTFIIRGPPLIV